MVEISLSGSGEGPGWATSRATLQRPFCAAPGAPPGASAPRPRTPPRSAAARPPERPRSQAERGAARLRLVLDRRRRMGEGSAAGGPWGDGLGKGDVEGRGDGLQTGFQTRPRCERHLRGTHVAAETTRHGVD